MENTRQKGNRGEVIACFYLEKHGFTVIERNYLRKWGEIDVIAEKDGIIHFIEVKSVSYSSNSGHRPEENVHNLKLKRLRRVIQTYLLENKLGTDVEFMFHVITVRFSVKTRKYTVKMLENIIL